MSAQIIKDTTVRMDKSIAALKNDLLKLRSGRAHAGLLEHVVVDYYGTETPP